MRPIFIVAISALLVPSAIGENFISEHTIISFATPATIDPIQFQLVAEDAHITLILFQGSIEFDLSIGAQIQELQYMEITSSLDGRELVESQPVFVSDDSYPVRNPGTLVARPGEVPLVVEFIVDELAAEINENANPINLLAWSSPRSRENFAPEETQLDDAFAISKPWGDKGVFWISDDISEISLGSAKAIRISTGIVDCEDVEPCPSSEHPSNFASLPSATGLEVHERRNIMISSSAQASVDSDAFDILTLVNSPKVDLEGEFAIRLPRADSTACRSLGCDAEKTIRLTGNIHARNIQLTENDRMSAHISGDIHSLYLNEEPIDPSLLFAVTATSVTAAALIAAIASKLGFFGLFTRLTADKALEHPRRKLLHGYIVDHPGATFRELVRHTGIPTGTARHHLTVMRRSDLIVEKPHKSTLRFFENHGKFDASWDTVVFLREKPLRQLHEWLMDHPGSMQKEIVAAMEAQNGWGRGTIQHRLKRLIEGGLVTVMQQGRVKRHTAHAEPVHPSSGTDQWQGLDASWRSRPLD